MKENKKSSLKEVNPVPKGFHTITPFLAVKGAETMLHFINEAFGGTDLKIMHHDNGKVMHATIRIGNSIIMASDSNNNSQEFPAMLYLYVDDVDAVYKKAIKAGGESLREPTNEFYGDRSAGIKDEWGNQWWVATHIEDVSEDEINRRAAKFEKQGVS